MILVKISLCPRGDRSRERHLGTAEIFNDSTGTLQSGNYGYRLFDKGGRRFRTGSVRGFPRKRLLAFDLLFRVLGHAFGERNTDRKARVLEEGDQTEVGRLQMEIRQLMWLNHGHDGLYGDDGEMQCSKCAQYGCWDYRRSSMEEVKSAYQMALLERAGKAMANAGG